MPGSYSKHFHGLSSIGKDSTTNHTKLMVATQVLVILVVAIDSNWKVSVTNKTKPIL